MKNNSLDDFISSENENRLENYSKSISDENFLLELNESLIEFNKRQSNYNAPLYPPVFIFGLPRSGTTLISQLLCHSLNAYWPTNLMARFWKAPVIGMRLSSIFQLFDIPLDFKSEYGVTEGIHQPHEFGYYWMELLNYQNLKIKTTSRDIDETIIRNSVNAILNEANKPVIFKDVLYGFHLDKMLEAFPNAVFIYCKRDMADVAVSFENTRKNRYGDKFVWWSFKTPDYNELKTLDYSDQICKQIDWMNKTFEAFIDKLNFENLFQLHYENLNKDIGDAISKITKKTNIKQNNASIPEIKLKTYKSSARYKHYNNKLKDLNAL